MLFRKNQEEVLSPAEELVYNSLYNIKNMTEKQFEAYKETLDNLFASVQSSKKATPREDRIDKIDRKLENELLKEGK